MFSKHTIIGLCTVASLVIAQTFHRRWSRNFAWKVADGVATHSKPYWSKGGGWLVMVDISYTMLHERTSEGGG